MKTNYNGFCPGLGFLEDWRLLEAMMSLEWIDHFDNIFDKDGYLMILESLFDMFFQDRFNLELGLSLSL